MAFATRRPSGALRHPNRPPSRSRHFIEFCADPPACRGEIGTAIPTRLRRSVIGPIKSKGAKTSLAKIANSQKLARGLRIRARNPHQPPPIKPLAQNTDHSNHPVLVRAVGVSAERFKGYYDNTDFGKTLKALIQGKNQE
jgi:hypothetical protein